MTAIPEHFELAGKRALVVDVENPAGAAIARAYAEAGADVALAVPHPGDRVTAAKRVQQDIEALGRKSGLRVMDVALGEHVQVTMRQSAEEIGGIDIVVSAVDAFLGKPFAKTTDADLQRVFSRNFNAHFFIARSASEEMRRRGEGGRIVLVTSLLGERGVPNTTAYAAAHAATQSLVRTLSQELGADGITVNAISLGWMDWMSDRLDGADENTGRAVRFTIMKRAGTADEVAPLAVYLAGSGTGYVTGQVLKVDGGLSQHL